MRLIPPSVILFASLAVIFWCPLTIAQQTTPPVSLSFDFRNGPSGWQAGFADYPPATDNGFYELRAEMRNLPAELNQSETGFYIQGNNHSDDLFMFLKRRLGPADGIIAEQRYQLYFTITFASNAQSGCVGAGGSPGDSVGLKAGGTPIEPLAIMDSSGWLRMNVPKDSPGGLGGSAASGVGPIANGLPCDIRSMPYVSLQRNHLHGTVVTANSSGELWLLLGTDSGFEGLTALYYQRIDALLVPIGSLTPAPVLLAEENSERAIAVNSVTRVREPFSVIANPNFSLDHHTRLMLFARSLELLPGENVSAVTAQAEDAQHQIYPLPVEFVGKVATFNWLTQLVIKLPDEIEGAGDVLLNINVHNQASNKVRISIQSSSNVIP